MKCSACVVTGVRSQVTVGPSMTTAMAAHHFYDEEGRQHFHNPNKTTTNYWCSIGHEWATVEQPKCWCES